MKKKLSKDINFDVSGNKFIFTSNISRKKLVGRSSDARLFLDKIDKIKGLSFNGIRKYLDSIGVKYVLSDLFIK